MKKLISESIIVGWYSLYISVIIINSFSSNPLLLNAFIIGFIKHFIGGSSGLYKFYCSDKLKTKCNNNFDVKKLILESVIEGFLFLIPILLITKVTKINHNFGYLIFFMIGFSLHILCENLGIHKKFCEKYCN